MPPNAKPRATPRAAPRATAQLQRKIEAQKTIIKELRCTVADRDRSLITAARGLDMVSKKLKDSTSAGRNKAHAAQEAINAHTRAMEALGRGNFKEHETELRYEKWFQQAADGIGNTIKKTMEKSKKRKKAGEKPIKADYIPKWQRPCS